jgi:hypothetical protein
MTKSLRGLKKPGSQNFFSIPRRCRVTKSSEKKPNRVVLPYNKNESTIAIGSTKTGLLAGGCKLVGIIGKNGCQI